MTTPLLGTLVAQILETPIVMPERVVYFSREEYVLASRQHAKKPARRRRVGERQGPPRSHTPKGKE